MKCLVSGATGFIGRQLCQQLINDGHSVVALSRGGCALADGTPTLAFDLATDSLDSALFEGVDVVLHLAGIAHQQAASADYEALNVVATLKLAKLAAQANVSQFIFLSSVKAMGPPSSARARAEADCVPPVDDYGRSKRRAEDALRRAYAGHGMAVHIVRPALVYGAQAKGNLRQLAKAVDKGLPRPPDLGARSMIAIDDLVSLLCQLAAAPAAGINTWIACGAQAYSTQALYDLMREASGREPARQWLPLWAWRVGARVLDLAGGLEAGSSFDKLFAYEVYDSSLVQRSTGWQAQLSLEQRIADLVGAEQAHS